MNDLIPLIVGIVGFIASVFGIWDFLSRRRRRREVTWREVDRAVIELVEQIERDKFTPEVIVCVGRGGAIIGAMVATNLPGPRIRLGYLDTEIAETPSGLKTVEIRSPSVLPDLAGKEVLVAVGELWSGLDLEAAFNHVQSLAPARIRTLAMLSGKATTMRADFCAIHTKYHPRAPWRINEHSTKIRG